jgi:transposase
VRKKESLRNRRQNKRVLQQINHNAAGVDIGSDTVWIGVGEHASETPVQKFGTTSAQLRASAEWMISVGVDRVAIEATGVYWVPAYEIYEEYGLHPILINSRAIRAFNGMKKSDYIDCRWIQLLHTFGILQPSVRVESSRKGGVLRRSIAIRGPQSRAGEHGGKAGGLQVVKLSSLRRIRRRSGMVRSDVVA